MSTFFATLASSPRHTTARTARHALITATGSLLTALYGSNVWADSILLNNGDKISGTLIKKENDKVIVKTSYAGELQIQWSDIASISADQNMLMVFTDGSKERGRILPDTQGKPRVITADSKTSGKKKLQDIQYLNPSKALLGEGPKLIWSGNLSLGAAFNSGNSDNRNVQFNGESVLRGKDDRYTVQGFAYWAQDNGAQTQNNSRVRGQYDHFFSKQWYGYLNSIFENDRFRDLQLRTTLGVGSGYQIFEGEKLNLSVEGGVSWVHQNYYAQQDDNQTGLRWAINYNQFLFDSFVQAFHRQEVLYIPQSPSSVILFSQSGLRFPFILGLSATTQLDYNYVSRPVDDRKKGDARALFTLGYNWK